MNSKAVYSNYEQFEAQSTFAKYFLMILGCKLRNEKVKIVQNMIIHDVQIILMTIFIATMMNLKD